MSWHNSTRDNEYITEEPVKIRCNFVVIQQSGSNPDNFEDNNAHRNFLLNQVVPTINDFFNNVTLPSDPAVCACEQNPYINDDCYIQKTGIELVFTDVHFIIDNVLYGNPNGNDNLYINSMINKTNTINIFLTGIDENSNGDTLLGGNATGLIDSCFSSLYIRMANTFPTYGGDNSKAGIIAQNITHEIAHLFGLGHLYTGTSPSAPNSNSDDYLEDVEGTTMNGDNCPLSIAENRQPIESLWTCDPHAFDHFDPNAIIDNDNICTNNIMGGTGSQSYFSPMQIGKMHRSIREAYNNDSPHIIDFPARIRDYQKIHIKENTSEIWTNDIDITQDILIQGYSCLTIQGTVNMAPNTKITVTRCGRLIIDGGTITSSTNCGDSKWDGIEVYGLDTKAHPYISAGSTFDDNNFMTVIDNYIGNTIPFEAGECSGVIMVINGGRIENAVNGVSTKKDGFGLEYAGGIIYANDAHFVNNSQAIEMWQYPLWSQQSIPQTNVSRFKDCIFETTVAPDETSNAAMVMMWDVHDVLFQNCTFNSIPSKDSWEEFGITSIDADYNLKGCQFKNLVRAVECLGTSNDYSIVNIEGRTDGLPDFYRCAEGVIAANINTIGVQGCLFKDSSTGLNPNYKEVGIQIQNTRTYPIQDNHFSDIDHGIVLTDNGNTPNTILQNTFRETDERAILVQGTNNNLKLQCNDMDQGYIDLALYPHGMSQGWIPNQNEYSNSDIQLRPASNKFSTEDNNSFLHWDIGTVDEIGTKPFMYTYHAEYPELRYIPIHDNGAADAGRYYKDPIFTDYNYECFPEDEDLIPGNNTPNEDEEEDNENDGNTVCRTARMWAPCIINIFHDVYIQQGLIANKDTEELIHNIQVAPHSDQTRKALEKTSPYLSDEVLIAVATQTQLPFGLRKELLLENAPFNPWIWDSIQMLIQDFPKGTLKLMEKQQASGVLSARRQVELEIEQLKTQRSIILTYILEASQETTNPKQIRLALEALELMISKYLENPFNDPKELIEGRLVEYQWIQLLIKQGDLTKAATALEQLSEEHIGDTYFKQIAQLSIDLSTQGKTWVNIDETAKNRLHKIALSKTAIAAQARAILSLTDNERYPIYISPLPKGQVGIKGKGVDNKGIPKESIQWALYPNPTSNLLHIEFSGNNSSLDKAQLAIYDIHGRLLYQQPITSKSQSVPVKDLPTGMFICKLVVNGKIVLSHKLLIHE